MLTTSEKGLAVNRSFEGRALRAYLDEVGVITIGYGITNNDAEILQEVCGVDHITMGMSVTDAQSEQLLRLAMAKRYEPGVRANMGPEVTQAAFDAGGSFHYNTGAIARASWVKSYVAQNLPAVHSQIMQWNRAGGNVLAGLTRRRNREWEMISRGDYGPEGAQVVATDEHGKPIGDATAPTAPDVASARTDALAAKIVAAMKAAGYPLAIGADVTNIIYVEGMDPSGAPNAFRPNAFDSIRTLVRVLPDGSAKLLGVWDAITHAGMYWTQHRMNPAGAFYIALGPQTCWTMGHYHDMEALIQSAPIAGTRDDNEDFNRNGDKQVRGDFGVHHHWGYDFDKDDAGKSSAGCQVGRSRAGHNAFIALLKTDSRYRANREFMFTSTVLTAAQVTAAVAAGPGSPLPRHLDGTPGMLAYGDKGPEVADLQRLLIADGYDLGAEGANGVFKENTLRALRQFQTAHPNLNEDGVAGPATRAALKRSVDAKGKVKKIGTGAGAVGTAAGALGIPTAVWLIGGAAVLIALIYVGWQYRGEIQGWLTSKTITPAVHLAPIVPPPPATPAVPAPASPIAPPVVPGTQVPPAGPASPLPTATPAPTVLAGVEAPPAAPKT